ncbi:diguanylate cyclase [Aliiglaciecola sp. 2_MG-2023]|uniref:sensor domain-containing diguanylate cyclase n=1 Tax=unclassified Aliiglaciecola TaxID=2593648 RepID=UPI0026E30A69|nr:MULTISPECIES: diguanylate cyclase [unclassified Aliiglaciecola]MDO6711580.1 diguanylate cyclase [Aliiglaciecola sp. 2_MG-2023]MDO6752651.1 diguanylate cyclase [Aliiglaciecola sp. 1_MG-2023]
MQTGNLSSQVDELSIKQKGLHFLQNSAGARAALLLISWVLVWFSGALVEFSHHASVWFPPAGLTFAVFFVVGARAIPIVMLAAILVTLFTNKDYQIELQSVEAIEGGVLFGVAHILPYYAASQLLRWLTQTKQLTLPLSIISFLLIAAVASLIATFLVLNSLVFSDMMQLQEIMSTWLPFWIGDMAGIVVLSPLFFSIMHVIYPKKFFMLLEHIEGQLSTSTPQYKYKLLVSIALIVIAMLLAKFTQSMDSSFAIFFLVIPHMWIACTENAFFNILSLAVSSLLVVFLVDALELMEFVMVYQYAINVVATNAMFAIAVPALTAHNHQLKSKVFTDNLTQTASREYLIQRAISELRHAQWENKDLCLLVYDIDHFKKINDSHGHNAGDKALKILSESVKQLLRPNDLLGRFGGDEFIVLLPDTNQQTAMMVGNRLLAHINGMQLNDGEPLSISIGITEMQADDDFESLFKRADSALYEAKRSGRNCIYQH